MIIDSVQLYDFVNQEAKPKCRNGFLILFLLHVGKFCYQIFVLPVFFFFIRFNGSDLISDHLDLSSIT